MSKKDNLLFYAQVINRYAFITEKKSKVVKSIENCFVPKSFEKNLQNINGRGVKRAEEETVLSCNKAQHYDRNQMPRFR